MKKGLVLYFMVAGLLLTYPAVTNAMMCGGMMGGGMMDGGRSGGHQHDTMTKEAPQGGQHDHVHDIKDDTPDKQKNDGTLGEQKDLEVDKIER